MSSRLATAVGVVVVLGAVGLVAWGFIEAVNAEPAVAGSIATALLGVAGVLLQQHRIEQARLREIHRDRMTPIYDRLLAHFSSLADQEGANPTDEMSDFFKDLKRRQLLLGAPAKTLLAFTQWERDTGKATAEKDEVGMALAWEALLRAIRRDLGHDDSALPRGELLAVFLDDEARELVAQRT
jgi:hypothetical protein